MDAEAAQGRIVLSGSPVALAQPRGLRAGVEEDVVPAVDLVDDREGAAPPVGKLLDRGLPIRFGQEQLTQRPHVVKEQGRAMALGRVGGAGRVADQHHVIAGDAAGPDIVVREEADRSLLLDVLQAPSGVCPAANATRAAKERSTPVSRKRCAVMTR